MTAREILIGMPDEVFEGYIEPLIEAYGWPFESADASVKGTLWEPVFDSHSLNHISQLIWRREQFGFNLRLFHKSSVGRIEGLYDTYVVGLNTPFTNMHNGRERFFSLHSYIARTARFPVPVVLMLDRGGYRILDGNHRLAAMASFRNASAGTVDAWVGSHESNSTTDVNGD